MKKFQPFFQKHAPQCFLGQLLVLALSLFLLALPLSATAQSGEEVTIMLPGNVPMVLVKVNAGTFQMGSPEGERGSDFFGNELLHQVTLTQDYWIGKTEVTQKQWMAVMGTAMPSTCGNAGIGDDYPVYCVTWNNMAAGGGFVEKLNEHLETQVFRLPTEAEWERAARAGTSTRFSHGDVLECSDDCDACATHDSYMHWCGNSSSSTGMVGMKLANPFGLHDMHGNLWEFVQDRYGEFTSAAVTDPTGPTSGNDRVIKGGDWSGDALFSRSASRVSANPGDPGIQAANTSIGFRVATSSVEGLAFLFNAGLGGSWWGGPARAGEGAQIEVTDGGGGTLVVVATVYSYDPLGNQIFMIAVGTVVGDTVELDVFITTGGKWGDDFDTTMVQESQWGTGTFTGLNCESISMELRPNAEYQALDYHLLSYLLQRLTLPVITCPFP